MAVIEASVAGGATNTNGAWVGGVQPTNADDISIPATAGTLKIPTGTTLVCRSIEIDEAWGHELVAEGTGALAVGGATSKADKVACRIPANKVNGFTTSFVGSSGNTEKVYYGGGITAAVITFAGTAGTTYVVETDLNTGGLGEVKHSSGGLTINADQLWGLFNGSGATTRTLNIENRLIKLLATGVVWTTSTTTNLTLKASGSTIWIANIEATAKTFAPGSVEQTYYNLRLPGGSATTPKVKITQGVTLNNLEFAEGLKLLLEPTKGITIKLNRVISAKGTAGNKIVIESATAASAFTIEARIVGTDFVFDFCTFKDVKAVGAGSNFYAGANSTNVSGNTNLKFEAAPAHEHTLTITQAQTLTRTTTPSRALSGTQAQAASRATTVVRALEATQAQAVAKSASPARTLAASQSQSASRAEAPSRNLSVTQAQTVAKSATLQRALSITQAQSVTRTASPTRLLAAEQPQAAARAGSPTRALMAGQEQSASLARAMARTLVVTAGQEARVSRPATHTLEAGQAQTQTLARTVARSFAASQPQAASEAASPSRSLTAGQAQDAVQLHGHSNLATLTATQAASVTLTRRPLRTLAASASASATLARQPTRLSVSQGQSASIARSPSRTLTVGAASSASLARSAQRLLLTTQGVSAQLARTPTRRLLAVSAQAVTLVGALPEAAPFVPGKLTSSTVAATMTSSVESHDSSSVEPVLLAESSVD